MIRVCPHSDSKCRHGMDCTFSCATGEYDGTKRPMTSNPASVGPAPDGEWIEWSGGENPVPGEVVDVRYRDGVEVRCPYAHGLDWTHVAQGTPSEASDIIAYRIAPHPDREAEPTGGVDLESGWARTAVVNVVERYITGWGGEDADNPYDAAPKLARDILQALSVSPPVVEGSSLRDTQPGASLTVLGRLAEAEAELQRLRDAEWSDMSDAELGRCFKAFAASVEAHSKAEWRGDAEMRLGLMNMGLMQAIKMAAESSAETFTYKATGFHSEGVQHGDWVVTFARHQPTTPGEQGEEG